MGEKEKKGKGERGQAEEVREEATNREGARPSPENSAHLVFWHHVPGHP